MKKTTVVTIAVNKGGVGKSTISSNLCYVLGQRGYKVLGIDTDGQKNFSTIFGFFDMNPRNFYEAFMKGQDIKDHILETDYENVDIVIADTALGNIERDMFAIDFREERMRDILTSTIESGVYDFIIIDTSSNLGMLNASILNATDRVLIPIEPAYFSMDGLGSYMSFFNKMKEYKKRSFREDVDVLGIVLNMVDLRKNLSAETRDIISEVYPQYLLKTEIRVDAKVEDSQREGLPVNLIHKNSKAALCFEELAKEVVDIVKNK